LAHTDAVVVLTTIATNEEAVTLIRELLDRLFARFGLLDIETVLAQALCERLSQRSLVFNEEKMFPSLSHLGRRQYFDIEG